MQSPICLLPIMVKPWHYKLPKPQVIRLITDSEYVHLGPDLSTLGHFLSKSQKQLEILNFMLPKIIVPEMAQNLA